MDSLNRVADKRAGAAHKAMLDAVAKAMLLS